MNLEQKTRFWSVGKKLLAVVIVGALYYLFVKLTGWGIPCLFYLISHKYCPGCGVTRMCVSLVQLDFAAAFRYNALVMVLLPVAIPYGIYRWIAYAKSKKQGFSRAEQVVLILVAIMTVAYWILRNTEQFSYLAPV